MTLKVVEFPQQVRVNDIAGMARAFADAFEAGEYGEHNRALLIVEGEGIEMFLWGDDVTNVAAIGILECAKAKVVQDMITD